MPEFFCLKIKSNSRSTNKIVVKTSKIFIFSDVYKPFECITSHNMRFIQSLLQTDFIILPYYCLHENSCFCFSVPNRSSPNSPSRKNYFYHYINAGIYDVDNKFGDSCRQSLTSVTLDSESESNRNTIEFDFKRNVIRETSSANCSPKKFLLSSLKRTDSYNANHQHIDDDIEDLELKEASWFHSGLPRQSLEILAQKSPGDFIVRRSNNKNGSFTLSLRVPGAPHKIAHYLIVRTNRGYKIKVRFQLVQKLSLTPILLSRVFTRNSHPYVL